MDVPDILTVIHFGACEDVDMYVQTVGRAGRNEKHAIAVLLVRKGGRLHIDELMSHYSDNTSDCRLTFLFSQYEPASLFSTRNYYSGICLCCAVCQNNASVEAV